MSLTGFTWAGPPPFDQVKQAGLFIGMGLCWVVPRADVSVPTMSRHVFPPANDDFTRKKSPLVGDVNGLSDPKPDPIA